ncbi:MAG TPA: TetR/AcrR family transcriptional regulator [Vicinamibacterales bacterium]|nr:TetR/AcrR family transcriptional regulator [Vicinamibacterales bacterium]
MARPAGRDGQQTRQALLDAALELFAEKGYFGTSLRDIARAVGVRESALYNYFPSKESLFEAVVFADREETAARLAPFLDTPAADLRPFLEELALRIIEGFTAPAQRQRFRILMSDGIRLALEGRINLIDQQVGSKSQVVRTIITRLIDEGRLRGADAEFLTFQFIAPLMTWRQLQALRPDFPLVTNPRAFASAHVDQFLGGSQPPALAVPVPRRRRDSARARTR